MPAKSHATYNRYIMSVRDAVPVASVMFMFPVGTYQLYTGTMAGSLLLLYPLYMVFRTTPTQYIVGLIPGTKTMANNYSCALCHGAIHGARPVSLPKASCIEPGTMNSAALHRSKGLRSTKKSCCVVVHLRRRIYQFLCAGFWSFGIGPESASMQTSMPAVGNEHRCSNDTSSRTHLTCEGSEQGDSGGVVIGVGCCR